MRLPAPLVGTRPQERCMLVTRGGRTGREAARALKGRHGGNGRARSSTTTAAKSSLPNNAATLPRPSWAAHWSRSVAFRIRSETKQVSGVIRDQRKGCIVPHGREPQRIVFLMQLGKKGRASKRVKNEKTGSSSLSFSFSLSLSLFVIFPFLQTKRKKYTRPPTHQKDSKEEKETITGEPFYLLLAVASVFFVAVGSLNLFFSVFSPFPPPPFFTPSSCTLASTASHDRPSSP